MPSLSPPTDQALLALLSSSYTRLTGRPLLPAFRSVDLSADLSADLDAARWLYEGAPFCLLVHDVSPDPVFIYANLAAQRAFEYPWEEFVGLPSRLSAEAPDRAEREAFLTAVRNQGFVDGFRGLRVAKSGRRFWIEDTTVWNLVDEDDIRHGQAAVIRRCTPA
jgi:PAS domain-containing protein